MTTSTCRAGAGAGSGAGATGGSGNDHVRSRASIGTQSSHGLWRFGYEGTLNDIDGFESDNNSIPQHRVGLSFETYSDSGWSFSTHVDGLFFDSESAVLVGLFLQRSF